MALPCNNLAMDPFLYQYGIGAIIFIAGLIVGQRLGYIGLSGAGGRNLLIMLVGFLFFMVVQGYLQYAPMSELPDASQSGASSKSARNLAEPIDFAVMGLYLVIILGIGAFYGRGRNTTRDFFFGGQRFSWWLISMSLMATLVGSYSFVKYSHAAYKYGTASTQSYFNDWALMPLLIFGWLPIFYFSKVSSIPEYFARRFNSRVRIAATVSVLIYLISYVGVNLFTMGRVLESLLGWDILTAAIIVASVSAIYVTMGGQTSVIMTDLFQGLMLLAAGILILFLGVHHLGGFDQFWGHLPRGHRLAFHNFNTDPSFPSVGIFWQDAIANSAFFYFLNQGILMRFMATRSIREARRAAIAMPLILMPIAAIVVASGGWVGRALVHAGVLPPMEANEAFYVTSEFLSRPGVFGLILAALTAALMSTVDTLITAVSSIVVNDIYKPFIAPNAPDRRLLTMARRSAIGVTLLGLALVPIFAQFKTIYAAHGAMTAAVTPPLVVALILSVFWRRFTAQAAFYTITLGLSAILLSVFVPSLIAPFAHNVPLPDDSDGFLSGLRHYKFMRALFGLLVSAAIGITITFFTRPESAAKQANLTISTLSHPKQLPPIQLTASPERLPLDPPTHDSLPGIHLSPDLASSLNLSIGDLLYITDSRSYLGGLHSTHAHIASTSHPTPSTCALGPTTHSLIITPRRQNHPILLIHTPTLDSPHSTPYHPPSIQGD